MNSDTSFLRSLEDDIEGMLALSRNGVRFREYAAHQLLQMVGAGGEILYWRLVTLLTNHDWEAARKLLREQSVCAGPQRIVKRFDPGDHYHAEGRRFDTLDAAVTYLREKGFIYGGLQVVRVDLLPGSGFRTGD